MIFVIFTFLDISDGIKSLKASHHYVFVIHIFNVVFSHTVLHDTNPILILPTVKVANFTSQVKCVAKVIYYSFTYIQIIK